MINKEFYVSIYNFVWVVGKPKTWILRSETMQKSISILLISTIIFISSSCILSPQAGTCAELVARITVEAGDSVRIDTPVWASLSGLSIGFPTGEISLKEVKGSQRVDVPIQFEAGSPPKLWWILSGTTAAGDKRVYELYKSPSEFSKAIMIEKDDNVFTLKEGDSKILSYHHAVIPLPEGTPRIPENKKHLYERSGFIYPVWSTKGNIVTEIHPADHVHHFGIWMPWTHTRYEDKLVDFWNIQDGTGTVRFSKLLSTTEGPVYGGFKVEQDHVALKTSTGEKVILKEVWDIRAFNVGGPDKDYRLWDFKSVQRNITELPLIQEEYRYGGFAYRGAKQWSEPSSSGYLTSEGKTRVDGNGTRARWCDMYGSIDDQWEGVAIMSHPKNFQHPEPIRIIPDADYVYFVYCASVLGEWEMKPGEDHEFSYRIFVHQGKANAEENERVWTDYAEPPQVKVEMLKPDDAIVLFDGVNLENWTTESGKPAAWKLDDGTMQVVPKSGSIMTKQSFKDFLMHVEFKTPQMPSNVSGQDRANSGIYIQRRYEVQILDSYGLEPKDNDCGALYKFKKPDKNVCDMPGRWQSYDIVFRAARFDGSGENVKKTENAQISVWQNGVKIHDNLELENKTGAGKPEGPEPGPILLQDHGNEVSFRNIWIVPL